MARQGHNKLHPMPHKIFNKKIKKKYRWNYTMLLGQGTKDTVTGTPLLNSISLRLPYVSRSGSATTPLHASPSPILLRWSKLESSLLWSTELYSENETDKNHLG